jgi:predicted O-linked N-acetylglucosamine transferase (SPINDLY family)
MMGLAGAVADSEQDYVTRAVALGTDRDARARLSAAITEASGPLFEHAAAVRQFADWLELALPA